MSNVIKFKPKRQWSVKLDGWEEFDRLAEYYGISRSRMLRILAESFLNQHREHGNRIVWLPRFVIF
jgi:metal-responsive CopG/Arc/MetJ family transcriptional regulator